MWLPSSLMPPSPFSTLSTVFITLILLLVLVAVCRKLAADYELNRWNGICAFDLDDTITCGIPQGKAAVSACRASGYMIVINTARPVVYHADIDLAGLGLTEAEVVANFYYRHNSGQTRGLSESARDAHIAEVKTSHLRNLARKYTLPHDKIVLFDDNLLNIERARAAGFRTVVAGSDGVCGIPREFSVAAGLQLSV